MCVSRYIQAVCFVVCYCVYFGACGFGGGVAAAGEPGFDNGLDLGGTFDALVWTDLQPQADGVHSSLPRVPEIEVPESLFTEVRGTKASTSCLSKDYRSCRRGYGYNLNRVPFFVGDGCGPGSTSSQLVAGSATWIAEPLTFDAPNSQLTGGTNSLLYSLPNNPSVETIGGGFVPPTPIPGYNVLASTTIGTTNPVQSGVGGTLSFSGNAAQVSQGDAYEDGANNYFTTVLAPGSSGTTMFNSGDSGAIDTGGANYSSFAYYDYLVDTAMLTPGYNVGFVKLTENVSPLPRDRVYMNYSYFHNAFFSPRYRQDVRRFHAWFREDVLGWLDEC